MDTLVFVALGITVSLALAYIFTRLASFYAQRPDDYAGAGPEFDIRRHLNGPILCEGVIYGPMGRVTSRFVAEFEGTWEGTRGTLREVFRYDSGAVQEREWRLSLGPEGRIEAEADDLVGAGRGRQAGNAVLLSYDIRLPEESGGHVLRATDWMYLVENGTIVNRSQFRKFGIKVAELVATMRPHPERVALRDAA
ncbi:MAG: DUF3833 domain-containing protein [Shimia sp.]